MTSNLVIRVFGDGNGETIFIKFPNGKIGIVDFGYKDFLKWFNLYVSDNKLSSIEFLLWTHPHDDHTHYLIDLLTYCETHEIQINLLGRFHFGQLKGLSELIEQIDEKFLKNSTDIYVSKPKPGYLLKLFEKISDLKNKKVIKTIDAQLCLGKILYGLNTLDENVAITCIAPCGNDIDEYSKKYNECLDKACKNKGLSGDFSIESSVHNIISVALIIEFGDLKILLGGDVTNKSWQEIYKDDRYPLLKSNIVFLKAPHHGSDGAYDKEIWTSWGTDYQIIISPYNKSRIPKSEILEKIMTHSTNIRVLKDKSQKSTFGDSEFLVRKIALKNTPITTCPDATHHIKYEISIDGNIEVQWINE